MRKARGSQVFFFVVMIFVLFLGCNLPNRVVQEPNLAEVDTQQVSLPTQTLRPTNTLISEPDANSRCDLFSEETLSLYVLNIQPGDGSAMVYTQFPEMVIGLEDLQDDGLPWEYSASLGEVSSIWCNLFEGEAFSGRVYCLLPLPNEYRNTAQPFDLYVNGCETPIFSVARQSLLVEKVSGSTGGEPTDQNQTSCGPEPPDYPVCNWDHTQWCYCMGGFYTCELNTVYIPVKGICHLN